MKTGAKILIIDDEPTVCHFLEESLTQQGYDIHIQHTGKQGLNTAQDIRPDLILLDLELPDTTGLDILKKIRLTSTIPIIVLTVKNEDTDKITLLENGADDYVTKPFSMAELSARIKVALRHYFGKTNQSFYENGPLKIDFLSRIVTLNSIPIKLTTTEYDLLKLLATNAGKIVTQRQLLREIWGADFVEHTHYLRIYIAQLRKKLERDPPCKNFIATEPSVGYRLKELGEQK